MLEKGTQWKVLDHGYIKLIDWMGDDADIVRAARMSTNRGFEGWEPGEVCKNCRARFIPADLGTVNHLLDCPSGQIGGTTEWVKVLGDTALLETLLSERHTTPFEMVELKLEVMAPLMVYREWHRHRTQCLAGDTSINLISPRGTTYKRTIQKLFQLKYGGVIDTAPTKHKNGYSKAGTPVFRDARRTNPWRIRILPNCQNRMLRTFDEETGTYRFGSMRDIWESGTKEIWEVVTTHGTVRASAKHPFYTRGGWAELKQLHCGELIASSGNIAAGDRPIPPSLRQGIGVWTSMMRRRLILPVDTCYVCKGQFLFEDLQLDHVIPVAANLKFALDEHNLKPICYDCHRKKINVEQPNRNGQTKLGLVWARVLKKPVRVAEEMTYDLEMVGPDHNYVANGLVVHNSYNEWSARYAQMANLHYIPSLERICKQSTTNKQGSAEPLDTDAAVNIRLKLQEEQEEIYEFYDGLIKDGVAREIARINTPVSRYSKMTVKTDLWNWFAFLNLREDPPAQWEIREYAKVIGHTIIKDLFPKSYELWLEHMRYAIRLSRTEHKVLREFFHALDAEVDDGLLLGLREMARKALPGKKAERFMKKIITEKE